MAHGGKREGAGRKAADWAKPLHRARPEVDGRCAVHVTMRVREYVMELRTRKLYAAIRKVMERYLGLEDFRICHLSIQDTHLHVIVEASDRAALIKRMRSFTINCARAINRVAGVSGQVFPCRYHTQVIRGARQAHQCVEYVLCNWRKHGADMTAKWARNLNREDFVNYPVDPYSSGPTFAHWAIPIPKPPDWYVPLPVSKPRTRTLSTVRHVDPYAIPSWRRHAFRLV